MLSETLRSVVREAVDVEPMARLKEVIRALGLRAQAFFRRPVRHRRRPGRLHGRSIQTLGGGDRASPSSTLVGYKRLANRASAKPVRRSRIASSIGLEVRGLLIRRRSRDVELYQAAKLFELLPQESNELCRPM